MKKREDKYISFWFIYYPQYKSKFWGSLLLLNYCCRNYSSRENGIFLSFYASSLHQNVKTSITSVAHSKKKNVMWATKKHFMKTVFQNHTVQEKKEMKEKHLCDNTSCFLGIYLKLQYNMILYWHLHLVHIIKWLQGWQLLYITDQIEATYFS